MIFTEALGDIIGKYVADAVEKRFSTLKEALEHMFWWEEEFKIEVDEDGSIISAGKCPIYRYYSEWCDNACITFIEKIADKYGYNVKRTKKMPEYEVCEFIFRRK